MAKSSNKLDVYLEIGEKRIFAGALDWPGWCRSGRDEDSALQALFDYGSRYANVLKTSGLGFHAPTPITAFHITEKLKGNATTDFGAPGIAPSYDSQPVNSAELQRLEKLLKAGWKTFDSTVKKASGKTLRTGPRGGGRQLEGIIPHVLESSAGYLTQVGWKLQRDEAGDPFERTRLATLSALTASARSEIPARGPRGGLRWSARYFVRRIAWHILDHAWEIEDRLIR